MSFQWVYNKMQTSHHSLQQLVSTHHPLISMETVMTQHFKVVKYISKQSYFFKKTAKALDPI